MIELNYCQDPRNDVTHKSAYNSDWLDVAVASRAPHMRHGALYADGKLSSP